MDGRSSSRTQPRSSQRLGSAVARLLRLRFRIPPGSWMSGLMAHMQKPDFVFRRNGLVHLNRQGRQFSRLLAAEVCAAAVVMLDTPCSEVVWTVLAIHSIRQFPLHFPSCTSLCAITFQLESRRLCDGLPAKCSVSEYDREASTLWWPWPTGRGGGCCAMEKTPSVNLRISPSFERGT